VIAQFLYWLDLLPLAWTIDVVRLFARLPAYAVYPAANAVALFFALVLGSAMIKAVQPRWSLPLTRWLSRRVIIASVLVSALGVLLLFAALIIARPDGLLHVWFLDVGGDNAVLVTTPRGAHLLIDGGRFPSRLLTALGDRLPFTDNTLEILLLTQPDADQFGALPAVLDRYDWGVALTNGQPNLSEAFAGLSAALSRRPVVNVRAGYSLTTDDGLTMTVLNPAATPALDASLDANALALRLSYGNVSFLLTSELSGAGQLALVKSGRDLRSSVLQLPVQAYPRSLEREFVQAVAPQVAVVAAASPDPAVLSLVGDIPLYRTDQGGTIHLWSDGRGLWVSQDEAP
jgi:competence protein ComEC